MKLFRNLIFTTLVLAAGRVVAFPVEITKLTKGSGKDQITIFNIKDAHIAKKNDAINATALIDFAKKKNAMVFVEQLKINEGIDSLYAQKQLDFDEAELRTLDEAIKSTRSQTTFLNHFDKQAEDSSKKIETFDPRSALEIPRYMLDSIAGTGTGEQFYKALGFYASTLYTIYTTIKQSNDTITDNTIKKYCTELLENIKNKTFFSGLCINACENQIKTNTENADNLEYNLADNLEDLGKKIVSLCKNNDKMTFMVTPQYEDNPIDPWNNNVRFWILTNLDSQTDDEITYILDITILQKFDRAITAGNKNFIFCTGAIHADNLEKFFIDNGYKKLLLHKPDYLSIAEKEGLSNEKLAALKNALPNNSAYCTICTIAEQIKTEAYRSAKSPALKLVSSLPEIELSSILKNESRATFSQDEDEEFTSTAYNTHLPIFTPQNLLLAGGTLTLIAATKAYGPRLWNWIKSKF